PNYQEILAKARLHAPGDILGLDSVIFCGHSGRNVARAAIAYPGGVLRVLIKREHVVTLKERLANLFEGFGFVSKSRREVRTLDALQEAGIAVPQWVAHGADQSGCAFLVLGECTGALELSEFLPRLQSPRERAAWITRLGCELAAIHQAGFHHPDLYS